MLVVGRNGVGKTNLLESLHVATQGFSPRTRQDTQLIRFGESAGRIVLEGHRATSPIEISVTLRQGQAKEAKLNGAKLPSAESLRREVSTLVFTPDRLAVVKGGPAARRAYFDRVLARLFPARAGVPQDYLATLAQRNAALRRVQLGLSGRDALEPWTERIAELGAALVEQRRVALTQLAPGFAERADELGLPDARLEYDAHPPTVELLEARLTRDLERGTTGVGPHLDDVLVASGDRDLRQYGSQGEQRLAVLSLLLAEAELLPTPPLLLLDDVLSELDLGRREVLARRLAGMGQTMITATHRSALPIEPSQVVEVEPGAAK
ncbi:MAG: replication and repair protein RecF [Actinomycetia bacterium]|nr:replication and repair protein RecF [Actinomycetes bacterium]